MDTSSHRNVTDGAPIPRNFYSYLKSFGPGLVVALTWLGAGDLIDSAVAGGDYGYALMWAMVLSLAVRFAFVNIIAKYQLCNERGETVMAGLLRIHRIVLIFVLVSALVFAHFYGSYMIRGVGEATHHLLGGFGPAWAWSIFWVAVAMILVFGSGYRHVEKVFYVLLGILSITFIGVALWCGPDPVDFVKGTFLFDIPEQSGDFGPLLLVISLVGAVAGSISNLLYPYFIQQKGWVGPQHRKVQSYDLLFGIIVIIILDLSIWTIGAEVLHPENIRIENLDDLANLLTLVLGKLGGLIFYLGVFATVFTSIIGLAIGYGYMCQDILYKLKKGPEATIDREKVKSTSAYRSVALWSLVSPLIWSVPGMPGFVTMAVLVNAATVVVLPVLAGSLWYITANERFIGKKYRNRWWENLIMAILFVLAIYGTCHLVIKLWSKFQEII